MGSTCEAAPPAPPSHPGDHLRKTDATIQTSQGTKITSQKNLFSDHTNTASYLLSWPDNSCYTATFVSGMLIAAFNSMLYFQLENYNVENRTFFLHTWFANKSGLNLEGGILFVVGAVLLLFLLF